MEIKGTVKDPAISEFLTSLRNSRSRALSTALLQ